VYAVLRHFKEDMRLSARLHNTTELMFDIRRDFDRGVYDKERWDERLPDFRGVLILDDIGAERLTDFVAETFYLIVNGRYNKMLPTIFTSNFTIGELSERVGDRIASRIVEMCDLVELIGEDKRMASPQKIQARV
jgi:DNA replication protein DnaC